MHQKRTSAFTGQKLAALNCSWLPTKVFDWILAQLQIAMSGTDYAGEDRLWSLWPGMRHAYRGLRAQLKAFRAN